MPSPTQPRSRRRASLHGVALAAALGSSGCFHDTFVGQDDDGGPASTNADEEGTAGSSAGSTSSGASTDTGDDPSASDGDGTTTLVVADDSTGVVDTGSAEDSTGSTGEAHDESTGSELVLGVDELSPGDLVVTEVMWNPTCSGDACEWIEILNATASPVNLLDLYVQDIDQNAGNQGRVTADVIVAPGDVVVIVRGLSFWPYDFMPAAVYGPNPGLNNGSPDAVVLLNSAGILDETPSFRLDQDEGVAWSLSGDMLDAISNDASTSWCDATTMLPTVSTTEYGSPGELNDVCAAG